jgi:hypothetical protein
MSNLDRGPSKDAYYQVLIHLAWRFQRRRYFLEINQSETILPVTATFVNGSGRHEHSL